MKVKIPKTIKIGVMLGNVSMQPYMKTDENWRGSYNQRTNALQIDSQLSGAVRDRTFMHEVVHMIDLNYECDLAEPNTSRIANGFLEFLKDNLGIEFDWEDISGD